MHLPTRPPNPRGFTPQVISCFLLQELRSKSLIEIGHERDPAKAVTHQNKKLVEAAGVEPAPIKSIPDIEMCSGHIRDIWYLSLLF